VLNVLTARNARRKHSQILNIISMKKIILIILIIVIAGGAITGYVYFKRAKKPVNEFVIVKKGAIVQEVSVTGRVKAAQSVDLAFEKSGRVTEVNVAVGDRIGTGQILVRLENEDLAAQLAEARASVKSQQAKLEEFKKGSRPEEIKIQEVKVENAKISLEDARNNLVDKLKDAYFKSDDAIRSKADVFFDNPRSSNPKFTFTVFDNQLKIDAEWERFLLEGVLNSWKASVDKLEVSSDLALYLVEAKKNLNQVVSFLDKTAFAVNSLLPATNLSQTTIDTYKSNVSTARTNINIAINALSVAEEKFRSAESALKLAENELVLKRAGTLAEQIKAQEAQVEQAEANAKNIEAQMSKTFLRAPIHGVITKNEAKVGEIVSANLIVVSLISEAKFEIEANVPEADIAKIKIGNSAKVTLDAYGSDVIFEAKVVKIDPAETIIEGVPTYKTTLQFIKNDERIKSGMTANTDILTAIRENVLIIPQRAVISKDNDKIVRVLGGDNAIKEVKVSTGLRGSDGNIEITAGLNENDKVVIFSKD